MDFFNGCTTIEEIKGRYKLLARKHHPDLGGDAEVMKALNNAYEEALKKCDGSTTIGTDGQEHTYHYNEGIEREIMDAIAALLALKMPEVEITLIGLWIWITGDTKPHREELKALGCRWNRSRGCWYYRPEELGYRRSSNADLEGLAAKYGATNCQEFKRKPQAKGQQKTMGRKQKALG